LQHEDGTPIFDHGTGTRKDLLLKTPFDLLDRIYKRITAPTCLGESPAEAEDASAPTQSPGSSSESPPPSKTPAPGTRLPSPSELLSTG